MTSRTVGAAVLAVLVIPGLQAQQRGRGRGAEGDKPKVDIVQTVGCAEQKSNQWWLARAAEPRVTQGNIFNSTQIDAAKTVPLGVEAFQLVGVADFVDAEELLRSGQRKEFTNPDNVNATGQLRAGRKVLVKGMLVAENDVKRINLLSVVAIADSCS